MGSFGGPGWSAWMGLPLAAGAAARVGPDSCARTANMDAHQVPRRWGAAAGGSRWELVGRAGGSGRGKGAEEGEEEEPQKAWIQAQFCHQLPA